MFFLIISSLNKIIQLDLETISEFPLLKNEYVSFIFKCWKIPKTAGKMHIEVSYSSLFSAVESGPREWPSIPSHPSFNFLLTGLLVYHLFGLACLIQISNSATHLFQYSFWGSWPLTQIHLSYLAKSFLVQEQRLGQTRECLHMHESHTHQLQNCKEASLLHYGFGFEAPSPSYLFIAILYIWSQNPR